ncbi:MAG TPA: ABC transporter permease [Vicinamibacterales bacterium]|nr:ABC transporter permease [Vicinamibacterales bacterium]
MPATSDFRYSLRLLARSPIFAITSILSLAIGIAATAAIFSLGDALLLRPRVGVSNPETLVDVGRTTGGSGLDNFGYPLFERLREQSTTLESLSATQWTPNVMALGDASSSERAFAMLVSSNYFEVVGTRAAAGRFFLPEEDRTAGTHPVVVLSHDLWLRRFGGDASLIGQTIRLNNLPYTVIGIAEPGFTGTTFLGTDMWVPMAMDAHVRASDTSLRETHRAVWMTSIGRLRPGATVEQARHELDAIMKSYLREQNDPRIETWGIAIARSARVPAGIAGPVVGFVGVLGALTALVLLIACSNVAAMLLARALERRREVATRLAIGASRRRILGQLLLEGLMLALIAGVVSIPIVAALVNLLSSFQPSLPVTIALELQINPRVMAFAFLLATVTSVVFGLLPALQATRFEVAPALHGHGSTTDRRRSWLRQGLVAAQVAMALLLLVAAGLFLRSLQEAATTDLGFTVANVDTIQINTRVGGYQTDADGLRAIEGLTERFRAVPGITAVGASRMIPLFSGRLGLGGLRAPGYVGPDGSDRVQADWDTVTPGYFDALQVRIVQGRGFDERDREGSAPVAMINETMAARLWPGQDPIGRQLIQQVSQTEERALQIVGITRTAKSASISESPQNFIYVPIAQQFMAEVTFFVRHAGSGMGPGGSGSRLAELRQAVVAFDPNLPVIYAQTLEQATTMALLPQRLAAWIATSVGTIGLLLAALGLYGITAFTVAQRSREIALRMALGATRESVLSLVLGQAGRLALVGAAIGLALAAGVSQLLAGLLVGVGSIDPFAFGVATSLLLLVLLVATWTPARRAAGMDPMRALRAE